MSVLKLCGMALVFTGAVMTGIQAAKLLGSRVRQLELAIAVLGGMEGEFSFCLSPPDETVQRLLTRESFAQAQYLALCDTYCKEGAPFPSAWRCAAKDGAGALAAEDVQILASLADTLGQSDLNGQLTALSHTKSLLSIRLEHARERSATRGKLYRTMGMLTGLFLIILWV